MRMALMLARYAAGGLESLRASVLMEVPLMRPTVTLVILLLLAATATANAALCKAKSGALFVRDACKRKEIAVDAATIGAVGPRGDIGPKGDKGDAGSAGGPGVSGYEIVHTGPYSGGGGLVASCPGEKKVLGGGCEDNFTTAAFTHIGPSTDGKSWVCGFNGSNLSINAYAICANVQ